MKIQEFIEKAIEGGWRHYKGYDFDSVVQIPSGDLIDLIESHEGGTMSHTISLQEMFLDTKSWEAVGKVEGWQEVSYYKKTGERHWEDKMHQMVDHLIEGGTIESYLETL